MRILVTGVSGFAGAHLVRELLVAGHQVWGSDRIGSAIHGLEGGNAVCADLRKRSEVRRLVSTLRPEAIIHLAAQSSPSASWQEPGETIEINTAGTANLFIESVETKTTSVFLLVSSSDVYGKGIEGEPEFTEQSPIRPTTPYGASKYAAEQVTTLLAEKAGMRLIIARPFSHTGPGQTERFVVPAFARQIAAIEAGEATELLHGDLEPCRDFTDVRDVVRAYRMLIESPDAQGVFNIASGRAVSIAAILESLRAMAHCPIPCRHDPDRLRGEGPNPVRGSAARLSEATGWSPRIALDNTLADVLAEQRLAQGQRSRAEGT